MGSNADVLSHAGTPRSNALRFPSVNRPAALPAFAAVRSAPQFSVGLGAGARQPVCPGSGAGLGLVAAWAGGDNGDGGLPAAPHRLQLPAAPSPLPKVSAEQGWAGAAATRRGGRGKAWLAAGHRGKQM